MVSDRYMMKVGKKGVVPVVPIPQLYTCVAAFRAASALGEVVLIKNKVHISGKKIAGAAPQQIFVRLGGPCAAATQAMTRAEVLDLPPHFPLLVLEDYAKTEDLESNVREHGVMTILGATAARCDIKEADISDYPEKSMDEMFALASHPVYDDTFEVDHIFCSSIQDELASIPFCAVSVEGHETA